MHLPAYHPASRGVFTLIELLVVIAIVTVLASLLLPSLAKAKSKSRVTGCLGNQRQIHMALTLYADESNDWLMATQYQSAAALILPGPTDARPYFGGAGILTCPSYEYTGSLVNTYGTGLYHGVNGVYTSYRFLGSRGTWGHGNAFYGSYISSGKYPTATGNLEMMAHCPNLKFLDRVMRDTDNNPAAIRIHAADQQVMAMDGYNVAGTDWFIRNGSYTQRNNHWPLFGYNILYFDGHAQWTSAASTKQRYYNLNHGWMYWD